MCLLGASLVWQGEARADENQVKHNAEANAAFNEIMASPDNEIPEAVLVIIPSLKRGGFIGGAQTGPNSR